ncbi:unnamed protein product, partial [Ectocarpus sp. 13 AM-2016]
GGARWAVTGQGLKGVYRAWMTCWGKGGKRMGRLMRRRLGRGAYHLRVDDPPRFGRSVERVLLLSWGLAVVLAGFVERAGGVCWCIVLLAVGVRPHAAEEGVCLFPSAVVPWESNGDRVRCTIERACFVTLLLVC